MGRFYIGLRWFLGFRAFARHRPGTRSRPLVSTPPAYLFLVPVELLSMVLFEAHVVACLSTVSGLKSSPTRSSAPEGRGVLCPRLSIPMFRVPLVVVAISNRIDCRHARVRAPMQPSVLRPLEASRANAIRDRTAVRYAWSCNKQSPLNTHHYDKSENKWTAPGISGQVWMVDSHS
jgi:hypothetical protein